MKLFKVIIDSPIKSIESSWIELNEHWANMIELLTESKLESIKIPTNTEPLNSYRDNEDFFVLRKKLIDKSIITIKYSE